MSDIKKGINMKLYVERPVDWQDELDYLGTLFDNAGYIMDVKEGSDGLPVINVKSSDDNLMPTIKIKSYREDEYVRLAAKVTFPELNTIDFYYYDEAEYYLEKWAQLGKVITVINDILIDIYED